MNAVFNDHPPTAATTRKSQLKARNYFGHPKAIVIDFLSTSNSSHLDIQLTWRQQCALESPSCIGRVLCVRVSRKEKGRENPKIK
jgi:hypothetical protein